MSAFPTSPFSGDPGSGAGSGPGSGSAAGRNGDVDDGTLASPLGRAAVAMVGFIAFLWLVEGLEVLDDYRVVAHYGIVPRDPGRLPDIFTAPFLHVSSAHVAGNATGLFGIGLIAALAGVRRLAAVTLVAMVTSGAGVWLFAPSNTVTVGASGIVFGYLGYLLMRGLVDRRPVDVVIAVGVAIAYGSVLPGALPGDQRISWQGHLAGFVGGLFAAWLFRRRRARPAPAPGPTNPTLPTIPTIPTDPPTTPL